MNLLSIKQIWLSAALLLLFPVLIFAQQVQVKGKVYDSKTNETLTGVTVTFGKNLGTYTDYAGSFTFDADSGKTEISFRLLGYQAFSKNFLIHAGTENYFVIALEPLINELNEVVVSADKMEKRISELSVSMSIIKPFEITKNHLINAEELINRTQGIEIMDGQASIRGGSGFSYGAGSRVLALVDGLPMLAADAGNIRWQFLPLENLAQVELIKGASSVLYGSAALNGVINFRTAPADSIPEVKFSVSSGFYDKPKREEWAWWDSPRVYSNASFSFSQKINRTEVGIGSNILIDNGYRRLNDEKLARMNLSLKQHSKKIKGLSYGAGLIGGYNIKRDFILWENADSGALRQNEETSTELNALYLTLDPFISLKTSDVSKHDFRMRIQVSDNSYPDNKMNNSQALSNFAEYQYFNQFFDQLDLIAGSSFFLSKITSEFYGNHQGTNLAAYTQLEYKMSVKLKISGGIRLEYNALDQEADKIVPVFRSGLNFQAAKSTFLRASFGQGYRFPSIAEKYAYTRLGAVTIIPNPEIKAEKGWSSEIGLKQGIKAGKFIGQADFSFFYSRNIDMIEYIFGIYPDPITGEFGYGFRSSNLENSEVYGTETEFMLNGNFGRFNINFGGGYTYIHPLDIKKTGNQSDENYLKYRRKHTAKLTISASMKKFELGLNSFFKSKILNIDDVFLNPVTREDLLPGFYEYWIADNTAKLIADFYLAYRITNQLKFSIGIKNLGNTEYMGRPGDIMPHRFYSFQLSGRF